MKQLIPLLLLPSAIAGWLPYANTTPPLEYEYNTVTYHDNNGLTLVVWTRHQTQNQHITEHTEVHCPTKMTRTFNELRTNNKNEVVFQDNQINPRWQFAYPDTTTWLLVEYMCETYKDSGKVSLDPVKAFSIFTTIGTHLK